MLSIGFSIFFVYVSDSVCPISADTSAVIISAGKSYAGLLHTNSVGIIYLQTPLQLYFLQASPMQSHILSSISRYKLTYRKLCRYYISADTSAVIISAGKSYAVLHFIIYQQV